MSSADWHTKARDLADDGPNLLDDHASRLAQGGFEFEGPAQVASSLVGTATGRLSPASHAAIRGPCRNPPACCGS